MNRSLRIAVADDEPDMRDYFQQILPRLGHEVVAVAENGRELVEQCRDRGPTWSSPTSRCPTWTASTRPPRSTRDGPSRSSSSPPTTTPTSSRVRKRTTSWPTWSSRSSRPTWRPAIALAMRRFEQFQALRKEAADLRQALEDRKVIERAKGILMKQAGLDEQDAFRRLQKLASDKNRKLVEIAQMILIAEEAAALPAKAEKVRE